MAEKLYGPLDDLYSLGRYEENTPGGASSSLFSVDDPEVLERILGRFLQDPTSVAKLRRALGDSLVGPVSDRALVQELARRIRRGEVVVQYLRGERNDDLLPGITVTSRGDIIETDGETETEHKTFDWRVECQHHSSPSDHAPGRPLFDSSNLPEKLIMVVPDQGTTFDLVKVHLLDERKPTPPKLTAGGQDVPKGGSDGGYDVYPFKAEFDGDLSLVNFLTIGFWTMFGSKTEYQIVGGHVPIKVQVRCPKRYAFKFALPPRRAYRAGYRLTRNAEVNLKDMSAKFTENQFTVKGQLQVDHGWSPSNQTINTDIRRGQAGLTRLAREAGTPGALDGLASRAGGRPDRPGLVTDGAAVFDQARPHDPHESPDRRPDAENRDTTTKGNAPAGLALFESITYTVDGAEVQLGIFTLVDTFLVLWQQIDDIIEAIQSNAPQVGFFANVNLQLMQGALAIQWYWAEHTDHRVFRQLDVNLSMTIFNISIELGIGVSGFGCRAQVFVSLGGDLVVYVDGRRDAPDLDLSAGVGFKASIVAAVGARFDVGNFINAIGKGESSLILTGEIGLFRRSGRAISAELRTRWTGIRAVVKGSAGLMGVGGSKTFLDKQVVAARDLGKKFWPSGDPAYVPPTLSRELIRRKVEYVITEGWNVRVRRRLPGTTWLGNPKWEYYSPRQISEIITDRIDRDTLWRRTARNAEALAHAIRGDLNVIGGYSPGWFGDPPLLTDVRLRQYLGGGQLQGHLDGMVDGTRELAQAAGGP